MADIVLRRKVKSTKLVHDVHGKLAPGEPVYASSSPSGPVPSPRRQSLSRAPESNESLSLAYDQDGGDIDLEIHSDRPASLYNNLRDFAGLLDPSINNEDELRGTARYQADIAGESLELTSNLPWRQRLPGVQVTEYSPDSYLCDPSSLPSNYRDNTRYDSNYRDNTHHDSTYRTDAVSYGPHASYYSGLSNLSTNYKNKIRNTSSNQADIPDEPINLTTNVLSKQQHAIGSSPRTHSESSICSESNKPIEPISQVETKPISQELLVTEGESIYASLTIAEKKCLALDKPVIEYGIPTSLGLLESDAHKGGVRLRHRGNPYIFPLNAKPRENRRKVLRVRINDQDHLACPDSGSEKNIISKACAIEHGFRIRRRAKDIKRFEVGNGDIVWSIGRVLETVGLPGSPLWQKKRRFYVLENCPVPLVMGMKFLKEAQILTKYRHLLENCPAEISNIPSLLWIGSPRSRLRCTIDGRKLEAAADTGSDLNLMSLECAAREGFRIDTRVEARTQIILGNNKQIETTGQVYVSNLTLDWREPETDSPEQSPHTPATDVPLEPDPHGNAHSPHREEDDDSYTTFHVVKHLPCEVVFGHKFLDDTDAFNKCPELLDYPPPKQSPQFGRKRQQFEFMIFRANIFPRISFSKKPKLAVDLREQHDSNWHGELYRRSKNTEEKIALLPPDNQEAARRTEKKNVQDWKTKHASCRFCKTRSTT